MGFRKIVLARRPHGVPVVEDFRIEDGPIPEPGENEVTVEHHFLGLAPRARIQMSEEDAASSDAMQLGDTVYGAAAGTVIRSNNERFPVGTPVASVNGGWQTHAVSDGSNLTLVDTSVAHPSLWLGTLGISGFAAYVCLLEVGKPQRGETVVVSSAAGAVGSVAAQIATLKGCREVGIAGGAEKCRYVEKTFGVDACVDYQAPDFTEQLAAACPDGVDVYFDNVGGRVRDGVWPLMNPFGRVVVCGQISQYVRAEIEPGPDWYPILTNHLTVQGASFTSYLHKYDEFISEMSTWTKNGDVVSCEHLVEGGFEATPEAFIGMLKGRFMGKVVVPI